MGLWDFMMADGTLMRVPYAPALEAFREAQRLENHETLDKVRSWREQNQRPG
jgi:hypothetical protein